MPETAIHDVLCVLCRYEIKYRDVIVWAPGVDGLVLGKTTQGYRHHATGAVVCVSCPGECGGVDAALANAAAV